MCSIKFSVWPQGGAELFGGLHEGGCSGEKSSRGCRTESGGLGLCLKPAADAARLAAGRSGQHRIKAFLGGPYLISQGALSFHLHICEGQ